jgi:hypothetical protein
MADPLVDTALHVNRSPSAGVKLCVVSLQVVALAPETVQVNDSAVAPSMSVIIMVSPLPGAAESCT